MRSPICAVGENTEKLGMKPGQRIVILNAPESFDRTLGALPQGVTVSSRSAKPVDLVITFETSLAQFERRLPGLANRIHPDGAIWIVWPKKTSGVATNLSENPIRGFVLLTTDLVDVKVCAIDDTWSGLKLVIRKEQRAKNAAPRG